MNGRPLIQFPVKAALASKYVDEVWVATDCRHICNVALDTSSDSRLKVYKRSDASSQDSSNSEDVLIEFSNKYYAHGFSGVDFDILVFMQCTSPLTKAEDIDGALQMLDNDPKCDSVLTCCEDHGGRLCGGFTWESQVKVSEFEGGSYVSAARITPYAHQRQNMTKRYRENGAVYVSYKKDFLKEKTRLPGNTRIYEMPRSRSFEIDSKEDLVEIRDLTKTCC